MASTTRPKTAQGTLLKVGDGAAEEQFLTIGRVTRIGGPAREREMIESTVLDNPDGWRDHIPGLRDGGELPIEGQFIATDAGQLELAKNLDEEEDPRNFQIVLPVAIGKRWAIEAYVIRFEVNHAVNEIIPFTATLKIIGKPVLENVVAP